MGQLRWSGPAALVAMLMGGACSGSSDDAEQREVELCGSQRFTCWIEHLDVWVEAQDPARAGQSDPAADPTTEPVSAELEGWARLELRWIDANLIWDLNRAQQDAADQLPADFAAQLPTITTVPSPMTFGSTTEVEALDIDFEDPTACRPAFCITICNSDRTCSPRAGCARSIPDGYVSGTWRTQLGYTAEPTSGADGFDLVVWPITTPECGSNPGDCLDALEQGNAGVVVGSPLIVPQTVMGPAVAGGSSSGGSGGGGSSDGAVCSTRVCYESLAACSQIPLTEACAGEENAVSGCQPISPDGSCFDSTTGSVNYSCAVGQVCNISCTASGWPTSGVCQ